MSLTIPTPTTTHVPQPRHLLATMAVATKWQRAAIVWAYVGSDNNPEQMTAEQFADLGIIGLSSVQFVNKYRTRWDDAILAGVARPVRFGSAIDTTRLPAWSGTGNVHMARCTCGCQTTANA